MRPQARQRPAFIMNFELDTYCVMGNPVEHSRSPWIHARFAELTAQTMSYERQLVALDGFERAVRRFGDKGGRGCNVTVPFKLQAAELADSRSERVQLAQAANTLVFRADGIYADNTDGLGIVADITVNAATPITGRDVLLLGAGGAAAGALGALLAQKPRRLVVSNRTAAKAQQLVAQHAIAAALYNTELLVLDAQALAVNSTANFDIIINATASSLAGAEVPAPASVLRPGSLAYDMMYGPAAQPFLAWAQQHGAVARDGLGMLVEQAAESFELWRGVRPPSVQVLNELRALLQAA